MVARLHSWLQSIKQYWVAIGSPVLVVAVVITLIIVGYRLDWTGFARKTLWDWLGLLIVPVVLAIAGFWLNQLQKSRDDRATEQRAELERKAAEQRAELERKAAEQQAELERALTRDNQRETLLQAYIDRMSELLEKHLRESQPEDGIWKIARIRTLTVLSRLLIPV